MKKSNLYQLESYIVQIFSQLNFGLDKFIPLQYIQIGLDLYIVGLIQALEKFFQIICSLFFGQLTDYQNQPKLVLGQTTISGIFFQQMILTTNIDQPEKSIRLIIFHSLYGIVSQPHLIILQTLVLAKLNNRIWELSQCKLYGSIFYGLINVLIGMCLDVYEDYTFLLMFGIIIKSLNVQFVCAYLPESSQIEQKKTRKINCSNEFIDQFKQLFSNKNNLSQLINYGINLANMRLIDGLIVVQLRELNATLMVCGFSVLLSVSLEPIIFVNIRQLINKLGIKYMLIISQALMIIRTLQYTIFNKAEYILYMEPISGIIFALSNASVLSFITSENICPKGMENSMNSIKNMIGIIPMISWVLIGQIMNQQGTRIGYLSFVVIQFVSMISFYVYNLNYEFPQEGQYDDHNVNKLDEDNIINNVQSDVQDQIVGDQMVNMFN